MGLFGWKKKKDDDKPSFGNVASGRSTERAPDFSSVRSGGGSTAAPAPAAKAPAAARRHTVVSGDSLSKIAKHHYGDANKWRRIYEANRQTIGDNPDLIKPGQDLVIPEEGA